MEKISNWQQEMEKEGKVFLIWLVFLIVSSFLFKEWGPLFTFFPRNSWEIIRIDIYGGDIAKAGISLLLVIFLAKFLSVFERNKEEILEKYGIARSNWKFFEVGLRFVVIIVGWYLMAGVGGFKDVNYISQENFPIPGSLLLIFCGITKIEIKTVYNFVNFLTIVLLFVIFYRSLDRIGEGDE